MRNKYNIGDRVKAKINFKNDPRKEVEAIIRGIELEDSTGYIKYKIKYDPDDFDKQQGCTGCIGYINQDDIIDLCKTRVEVTMEKIKRVSMEFDATDEQIEMLEDGINPFKNEMKKYLSLGGDIEYDFAAVNLDTGTDIKMWH